jgi:prepilin-type N-terminal cleavage/methylation domain-containing protein
MNTQHRKHKIAGFSLIELMIVIAIIGLLIAVGVPAWSYMVRNGNETAAIDTLRQINERQVQFASKRRGEFADNFSKLVDDTGFNENFKSEGDVTFNGYVFKLKTTKNSNGKVTFYSVNADPETPQSGSRYFYVDSNGSTIKANPEGEAGPSSGSI